MLRVVVAVLHAEDAVVGIGEGRATWPPDGEPVELGPVLCKDGDLAVLVHGEDGVCVGVWAFHAR